MKAAEAVSVVRALEAAGIRYVVTGGWGVDALLGRETRPHSDLDIAVDVAKIEDAIGLLSDRGYVPANDQRPARLELRAADDRAVDLHPVAWDTDGAGRQQGFEGRVFEYPTGSTVAGRIRGAQIVCISPALQREFHTGYEPAARDRIDMAALAAVFGVADAAEMAAGPAISAGAGQGALYNHGHDPDDRASRRRRARW